MLIIKKIFPKKLFIEDIQSLKYELLNNIQKINIEQVNWKQEFPDCPKVEMYIAYNEYYIFLHYQISEKYTLAKINDMNGSVWTDSCVEFFISFDNNQSYYNFETTAIGKCILGFCDGLGNKQRATKEILTQIKIASSLGDTPFLEKQNTLWDITIALPLKCFYKHPHLHIEGQSATANFYKCGDNLTEPHFISWTIIDTPKPSFHQPQFFGKIHFS